MKGERKRWKKSYTAPPRICLVASVFPIHFSYISPPPPTPQNPATARSRDQRPSLHLFLFLGPLCSTWVSNCFGEMGGVEWRMYKVILGRREECLATIHTAFAAVGAAFTSFFGDETAAECRQTDLGLSWESACWPRREREKDKSRFPLSYYGRFNRYYPIRWSVVGCRAYEKLYAKIVKVSIFMQKEEKGRPKRCFDWKGETYQIAKQPWFFFFSLTTTCCGCPCWYCICSFSKS